MILYFLDRHLEVLGQATTHLPGGLHIFDDKTTEEIKTGTKTLEFSMTAEKNKLKDLMTVGQVGNYILNYDNNRDEGTLYTITESNLDTGEYQLDLYAEDGGLDLLNQTVPKFPDAEMGDDTSESFKASIDWYMEKWLQNVNWLDVMYDDIPELLHLEFPESSLSERILAIADAFDCEIRFSYTIEGLKCKHKKVMIYKRRGNQTKKKRLFKNIHFSKIQMKQNTDRVATALQVVGAENNGFITTLDGLTYDDGDFYIADRQDYPSTASKKALLYSRTARQKWGRYSYGTDGKVLENLTGDIIKVFHFDTVDQQKLLEEAIKELTKVREAESTYETELIAIPDGLEIGDSVYIIDHDAGLYLSARLTKLDTSESNKTVTATFEDYAQA